MATTSPEHRSLVSDFPLHVRAEAAGVLDGADALVAAPTGTGKSFIGREVVRRALARKAPGTHAYLVPYRALADELHEALADEVARSGIDARITIATGDHRDPADPGSADVLVATYERYAGLLRTGDFRPGVVVVDEAHLLGEPQRGPHLESLLARLLARDARTSLCALSAPVDNAAELADWLGVQLLAGTEADRPVPLEVSTGVVADLDAAVVSLIRSQPDAQAIVFAASRPRANACAEKLAGALALDLLAPRRQALDDLARELATRERNASELVAHFRKGVAVHHAGLGREARTLVERAFREGLLAVVVSTPTLAAGVNLPAELSIVREPGIWLKDGDGNWELKLHSSLATLNMLGRAGRPGQVARRGEEQRPVAAGRGIVLVSEKDAAKLGVRQLLASVEARSGGAVESRMRGADRLQRFLLEAVAERGETTTDQLLEAYRHTLAHREEERSGVTDAAGRVDAAIDQLLGWRLLTPSPIGWAATPVGEMGAGTWHDLETVQAMGAHTLDAADDAPSGLVVAWAVADLYRGESDAYRKAWRGALRTWLLEGAPRSIDVPVRYFGERCHWGDFRTGLTNLSIVCSLYATLARRLGRHELAATARRAAARVRHGVKDDLVELISLNLPGVGRANARELFRRDIHDVADLAAADPATVAIPDKISAKSAQQLVDTAREIQRARAAARNAPAPDAAFDALMDRFRVDRDAFAD